MTWINSIIQASNSRYFEGMGVPQRILFSGVAAQNGNIHTLTFSHQFTKGGIHAYDFLTSWKGAQTAAAQAHTAYSPDLFSQTCSANIANSLQTICNNLATGTDAGNHGYYHLWVPAPQDSFTSYTGGTVNTKQVAFDNRVGLPDDGSGHSLARGVDIYSNAPISGGALTLTHSVASGGDTGDSDVNYVLTWTSAADSVLIETAGHLAVSGDNTLDPEAWTPTTGSSQINGGPYHFHIYTLDGASLGSQDNQIKGADILVVPPSLTITKTADAASVSAGSQIGFTITVSNASTAGPAQSVALSDPLPGGSGVNWSIAGTTGSPTCSISGTAPTQTLSCSMATLAAGASFTVHVVSGTTSASCATYNNTASVSATNFPAITAKASETVNCASIKIVKTADAASVSAGSPIGFTITVYNSGSGDATGTTLTDTLPTTAGTSWSIASQGAGWGGTCAIAAGVLTCGPKTVAGGTTQAASTFTVHITSPTTAATCGTVSNTGSVTTSNDGSGTSTASTTVNCASIQIVKTADAGTVSAGDPIGFTLTVYNSGSGDATGTTLTDTLPTTAGTSWSIAGQGAGWGGTCAIAAGVLTCGPKTVAGGTTQAASTFTVHITSPTTAASCGTVNNTGSVTTSNDGTGTSKASVTVNCPALTITKTADNASVSAGDPIGFLITVGNTGPGTAKSVTLSDPLPAGVTWAIDGGTGAADCSITTGTLTCSFGDMAPAASFTVHISATTSATQCSTYNNTATASASNASSVQASASITCNQQVSQITPTNTTCQQFSTGQAGTLGAITYSTKGSTISQVSPGVLFYWVKVTVASPGSQTFTINQLTTYSPTTGSRYFSVAAGSFAYNSACGTLSTQIGGTNSSTTVSFNATTAGTYYIGIKYSPSPVVGSGPASTTSSVYYTYTFSTTGVPSSSSQVLLQHK